MTMRMTLPDGKTRARCLRQVWNVEWKRATFGWKEFSSPYQLGKNVKAIWQQPRRSDMTLATSTIASQRF